MNHAEQCHIFRLDIWHTISISLIVNKNRAEMHDIPLHDIPLPYLNCEWINLNCKLLNERLIETK